MPNGTDMLNDAEFESRVRGMSDRQLSEFTARQLFDHCQQNALSDKRITDLEGGSRKLSGITGGVTALVTSVVIGIISYFTKPSN